MTAPIDEHEVDDERGDRVAAGEDRVDGPHEHRVQREERGPGLELEVRDVGRDRAGVAAADDLQVPEAVPLREHAGDEAERRAGAGLEVVVGVDRHLAGPHAGAGEHAQPGHDEGADADGHGAVPRPPAPSGRRRPRSSRSARRVRRPGRPSAGSSSPATPGRPGRRRVDRRPSDRRRSARGRRSRGHHHRCIGRMRRRGPNAGGAPPGQAEQPDAPGRAGRGTVRAARAYGRRRPAARRRGSRPRCWGGGSRRPARRRRRRTPGRAPSRPSTVRCPGPGTAWPPARRGEARPSPTAGRRCGRPR